MTEHKMKWSILTITSGGVMSTISGTRCASVGLKESDISGASGRHSMVLFDSPDEADKACNRLRTAYPSDKFDAVRITL